MGAVREISRFICGAEAVSDVFFNNNQCYTSDFEMMEENALKDEGDCCVFRCSDQDVTANWTFEFNNSYEFTEKYMLLRTMTDKNV